LALAALGSGLVIGVLWAWRTSGTLGSDSAREVWMAVAWLITAMSLLAWQLDTRRSRWAAALVLVAATAVLIGLSLPVDLRVAGI
jgi:ABC-type transport system involved in cytochrome c biogenesis permease subunit